MNGDIRKGKLASDQNSLGCGILFGDLGAKGK
jgi:hypothetical protein